MHIEQIMKAKLPWIEQLVKVHRVEDLEDLSAFPQDIKEELQKIKDAASSIEYAKMVVSPLFYAKMRYYDSLTFRMFEGNSLLAMGGIYNIEGVDRNRWHIQYRRCRSSRICALYR